MDSDKNLLTLDLQYWRNHAWRVFVCSAFLLLFVIFADKVINMDAKRILDHRPIPMIPMPELSLLAAVLLVAAYAHAAIQYAQRRADEAAAKLDLRSPKLWITPEMVILLIAVLAAASLLDIQFVITRLIASH